MNKSDIHNKLRRRTEVKAELERLYAEQTDDVLAISHMRQSPPCDVLDELIKRATKRRGDIESLQIENIILKTQINHSIIDSAIAVIDDAALQAVAQEIADEFNFEVEIEILPNLDDISKHLHASAVTSTLAQAMLDDIYKSPAVHLPIVEVTIKVTAAIVVIESGVLNWLVTHKERIFETCKIPNNWNLRVHIPPTMQE